MNAVALDIAIVSYTMLQSSRFQVWTWGLENGSQYQTVVGSVSLGPGWAISRFRGNVNDSTLEHCCGFSSAVRCARHTGPVAGTERCRHHPRDCPRHIVLRDSGRLREGAQPGN